MTESWTFQGFPKGKVRLTSIPEQFFTEILPHIESVHVIKVLLYIFWVLNQRDGNIRYVRLSEMETDEKFLAGLDPDRVVSKNLLYSALKDAVDQNLLLKIIPADGEDQLYFVNTDRSRSVQQLFETGNWKPGLEKYLPISLDQVKPNVFALFEQNIGLLTPLLAEKLKLAEQEYPATWLADAIGIAVENNIRKWSYIEAILKSWRERGKDDENRRNTQENYSRYIEGEFARFIKH